jgi:hypothetical protein
MFCEKNGVGADYGHGHVYPGDLYKCPDCGVLILSTVGKPIQDSNYSTQDSYIKMED